MRAFTLIELLVVITIIVVLLAMLTPALDKAIYQAELAVCAAQHHGVSSGMNNYAIGHRRRYPTRPSLWTPSTITRGALGGGTNATPIDDRPLFRPYFDVNALLCPPAGELDLDREDPDEPNAAFIVGAFNIFAGWQYDLEDNPNNLGPASGMLKLGDRLGWDGKRYNVMINDSVIGGTAHKYSPHPDDQGLLTLITSNYDGWEGAGLGFEGAINMAWTGWFGYELEERGTVDMNAASADGAVSRIDRVESDYLDDQRIDAVGYDHSDPGAYPEEKHLLIPRN